MLLSNIHREKNKKKKKELFFVLILFVHPNQLGFFFIPWTFFVQDKVDGGFTKSYHRELKHQDVANFPRNQTF